MGKLLPPALESLLLFKKKRAKVITIARKNKAPITVPAIAPIGVPPLVVDVGAED